MSIFSKIKARVSSARLKTKAIAVGVTLVLASVAALATINSAAASPTSTPDCDANAAVWCGVAQNGTSVSSEIAQAKKVYANGDGHNKYYMIQDMYNYFGMSTSVINGMSTGNVVAGYVSGNASGDVYATINGKSTLVATGAITAGRENISGSTKQTYGATTFYTRPTHVSFENGELAALIIMKDGVFQNAILASCGNPVKATPKKPNYSIVKQVRAGTSGNYASNVSVKSGSDVEFQITVSSTGAVAAANVSARDMLPAGLTLKSGTLQLNGKAVSAADQSKFFGTGLGIGSIAAGAKDVLTFEATAGKIAYADSSCAPAAITNTGYITSPGLPNGQNSAKVNTTCAPAASLACTSLSAVAGTADTTTGDQQYTFTAKSTAQNVTISSYGFDFGDKATATVKSSAASVTTTHTYAPGNYTAKFSVTGTAPATSKSYTSATCTFNVTVNQAPKPNYSIQKLVATSADGTYGSNVQVKSGATVYYKITVSSTGDAPVTNVNVHDARPGDIKFVSGSLKEDSTALTDTQANNFFGNGLVVASIKNGSSTVFTYSAVAGNTATDNDAACKAETLDNTGTISTTGLSNQQSGAEVNATCTQTPGSLACVLLTAIPGTADATTGSKPYNFSATATAANATVKTYTFTVTDTDTNKVVATIPVNSSDLNVTTPGAQTLAPGNYSASVTVNGTDNYGNALQAPVNAKCSTTFNIPSPECKPGIGMGSSQCFTYTCNAFTLTVDNATRKVTVASFNASSTNPAAVLAHVFINWGDGATVQTPDSNAVGQVHVFTADSSNVTATAQFTTPDSTTPVSSTICSQPVSFTIQTPPPVLPDTGAGDVIGIFVGTVAAGTIASRLFISRKLSRR